MPRGRLGKKKFPVRKKQLVGKKFPVRKKQTCYVLKPGNHFLRLGEIDSDHRLIHVIRDAGFEVCDFEPEEQNEQLDDYNVLSLFDGMSCGQIALERINIRINKYFASEIDKYAMKVTQHNYPNTIQIGDVTKVKADQLPKIDLLIGGSPCQGFSFAGKQLNFDDPQSKLFFEFVRLKDELDPKYFLLENVNMKMEYQDIISSFLGVKPIKINSSLVSAQNRERLYWTNINIPDIKYLEDKKLYLKDIIQNDVLDKYDVTERFYNKREGTLAFTKSRLNIRRLHQKSKTLTTGGHGISNSGSTNIYFSDSYIRIPTPIECERLQTVPDNYTDYVSNAQRYRMLGNGWTVDIIAFIFQGMNFKM